jgi:hypothetical protein
MNQRRASRPADLPRSHAQAAEDAADAAMSELTSRDVFARPGLPSCEPDDSMSKDTLPYFAIPGPAADEAPDASRVSATAVTQEMVAPAGAHHTKATAVTQQMPGAKVATTQEVSAASELPEPETLGRPTAEEKTDGMASLTKTNEGPTSYRFVAPRAGRPSKP